MCILKQEDANSASERGGLFWSKSQFLFVDNVLDCYGLFSCVHSAPIYRPVLIFVLLNAFLSYFFAIVFQFSFYRKSRMTILF